MATFRLKSVVDWSRNSERNQNIIALIFIAIFILLDGTSMVGKSLTYDEIGHLQYGINILNLNSTRFEDAFMPINALNAIPLKLAAPLPNGLLHNILERNNVARLMTVFGSALIAFLVFHWSRRLFGYISGLLSLVLYVFDPNILAHSQLMTLDIFCAGTIAFAFYCLWKFANKRSLINGIWCGFALGLSLIAKYTSVILFPLFVLCLIIYDFSSRTNTPQRDERPVLVKLGYKIGLYGLVFIVLPLLIVNAGFLFNRTFTKFGNYKFYSNKFIGLQSHSALLRNISLPLPYPYLQGLDGILRDEETGSGYGPVYLLGKLNTESGFPGYYLYATLFKMPIATQIIILGSIVVYIIDRQRNKKIFQKEIFILVPLLFYIVFFNFFFRSQIGIRLYLVVYVLLFVFAGTLLVNWITLSKFRQALLMILILYLVASNLSYYPYYLSYFNEIVWNRTTSYKYLADSNLDWGQSRYYLEKYLKDHPESNYAPTKPQAGQIVISANSLVGVRDGTDTYKWLRDNFQPDGVLAYTYYIFDITPQQISALCASTEYCK